MTEHNHKENDGGMNHGMGMMMLGCLVPMAAIVVLPKLGVSSLISFIIGIGGMIVLHAGMMVIPRLKKKMDAHRTVQRPS
jgi:hypothetical protein